MRSYLMTLSLLLFLNISAYAQEPTFSVDMQEGDLLLQDLDCGPLCDAIESVTDGFAGHDFSHIGLVTLKEGASELYIIEAVGSDVRMTRLDSFMARTKKKVYIARVKPEYQILLPDAIAFAKAQLGKPYDDMFLYDNGKYYCSELIYDAFKAANDDKPFFELEPMTFKNTSSKTFDTTWVKYYSELKMDIPEGKPGINPAGISRSNKLVIVNKED